MEIGFNQEAATHVQLFSLQALAGEGEAWALALLDEQERAALARARAPQRRAELLYGRAALRRVLAAFSGARPEGLRIGRDAHNKPCLLDSPAAPAFNVSHAGDLLGIVVAAGGAVGIDLEVADARLKADMMAIADRHFSAAERGLLHATPAPARETVFYRIWTLKEALLKATGVGLYQPLDSVDLADPGELYRSTLPYQGRQVVVEARHAALGGGGHLAVARVDALGALSLRGP